MLENVTTVPVAKSSSITALAGETFRPDQFPVNVIEYRRLLQ